MGCQVDGCRNQPVDDTRSTTRSGVTGSPSTFYFRSSPIFFQGTTLDIILSLSLGTSHVCIGPILTSSVATYLCFHRLYVFSDYLLQLTEKQVLSVFSVFTESRRGPTSGHLSTKCNLSTNKTHTQRPPHGKRQRQYLRKSNPTDFRP